MFLPVKFSGSSPILLNRSLILPKSCKVFNPWKIFHSNSIGSPSILSVSVIWRRFLTIPIFCSHASFDWWVFRESYQDTIQKLKKTWTFSFAENWWFFRHQLMTDISMHDFPNQSFPNLRSHLVLSLISQTCRTFASVWDQTCSQWVDNCSSNSFSWIPLIPLLQP